MNDFTYKITSLLRCKDVSLGSDSESFGHEGMEEYEEEEEDVGSLDPLFEDIVRFIIQLGKCSHAMMSRSFSISNVRTEKIMRQLENAGIIEYKVICLTDKELNDIMENDLVK